MDVYLTDLPASREHVTDLGEHAPNPGAQATDQGVRRKVSRARAVLTSVPAKLLPARIPHHKAV
jgi:hypothetical protein